MRKPPQKKRSASRVAGAVLVAYFAVAAAGWLVSGSPPGLSGAKNVILPGFGPDGLRAWELRAVRAKPKPGGAVEARELTLVTYDGVAVEVIAQSASAKLEPGSGRAASEATVRLEGPGYEVNGVGWEWDANKSRIRVKSEVKVLIEESFDLLH